MKKKVALLSGLLLSLIIAGTTTAADVKLKTKIELKGIEESHAVKVYNNKLNGVTNTAEIINGSLYFKYEDEKKIPFLVTYGEYTDGTKRAGFNIDGKTDVMITMGSETRINFLGLPQSLSDEVIAQLKRNYFPVRYVYEIAGYKVDYDVKTKSVTIHE
ncbi:hypothetical protein D3C75_415080 [compost metagenome]